MKRAKDVFGIIYSYPFYGLGWLAGFVTKGFYLTKASLQEGFEAGRKL